MTLSSVARVVLLVFVSASLLPGDYYDVLAVPRTATKKQIKSGYRKQALKWHPDKSDHPDAQQRFAQIAEAYEVLSEESSRRSYDAGGHSHGFGSAMTKRSSRRSADDVFRDAFGDVWRDWRPGMKVQGTFVRNGQKISVRINADGTSEESVEKMQHGDANSRSSYSYVKKTSSDGGTSVSLHLDGSASLAGILIDSYPWITWIVPSFVLGFILHPCVLCAGMCYCCCSPSRSSRDQKEQHRQALGQQGGASHSD